MPQNVPDFEFSDRAKQVRAFVFEFWCEQGRGPTLLEVHQATGLDRRLASVNTNANQNNPFQPDIQYRGFTASPLLGTPAGDARVASWRGGRIRAG